MLPALLGLAAGLIAGDIWNALVSEDARLLAASAPAMAGVIWAWARAVSS